jgi:oligo-1,6-glucosidase
MIKQLLAVIYLPVILLSCKLMPKNEDKGAGDRITGIAEHKWWKEAVIYQIYPRSFKDSDGDGIGDLKGIISKLDYVKSLGIDVVWLNPIFASPNEDNGYDVSDYRSIMKEFGRMEDFDTMLNAIHARGLKLVLDMVVNHSSSEHNWFRESRKSRDNPYRNYYHWWPAEKGLPATRFSFFDVNSSAWQYDSATNAYYLHYFSPKQPDLNWENPALREEIFSMMRFWLDKGVDGFRMDAIPFISKDTMYPLLPEKYKGDFMSYYANGPHLHEYLQEMNKKVLKKYDIITISGGMGVSSPHALDFAGSERNEFNMLLHSEGMDLGYLPGQFNQPDPDGYSLLKFKEIYSKWDSVFQKDGWSTIYLGNHDQPRMLTKWGNDVPLFREQSSKLLTTFLLSMRATPFYYYGDEIGMDNIRFDSIDDYRDIETITMYQKIKKQGGDLEYFLQGQKISARDNGRTPFQWNDAANAGFSEGTPWLGVNSGYKRINAAAEENDPGSILNYFRKMIKLRKENPALVYGKYELFDKNNPTIYAYTRTLDSERFLIILNFSSVGQYYSTPLALQQTKLKVVIDNYGHTGWPKTDQIGLKPYEAVIFKATK